MDTISFSDFQKLDIRIGTVIEASVPEWSHWVMKLTVDFGPEIGKKTIFSGIIKFYKPGQLIGKQFPFVVNLAPKKMGPMGDFSEGMMIMAVEEGMKGEGRRMKEGKIKEAESEEIPTLLKLWKKVQSGTKVR